MSLPIGYSNLSATIIMTNLFSRTITRRLLKNFHALFESFARTVQKKREKGHLKRLFLRTLYQSLERIGKGCLPAPLFDIMSLVEITLYQ